MEQNGEKSQDPTPHRRQEAREQGQVAHSQDLASAAILVGGLVAILFLGEAIANYVGFMIHRDLGEAHLVADPGFITQQWNETAWGLAKVVTPLLGVLLLLAVGTNLLQTGFLFLPERLSPDFSRINPLSGFGRIFSLTNIVRLGFGIIKLVIVATVAYVSLYHRRDEILSLAGLELNQVAAVTYSVVLWTSLKIAVALLILALLDYLFQWWKHEQDLKMTPQEVREEMRNLQGDPQILARRRQIQRQLALHRVSSAVPKADVVITNPTELAVAIQYDPTEMAAPIVVAKGAGVLAQRIRKLALEHSVPIIEKKPLAQALYKEVDLNHPIPDKMYAAVAEVLAYVYKLKGKAVPNPGRAA